MTALVEVSREVETAVRRMNPWWSGEPGPRRPPTRRHLVGQIERRLAQRLAPIVVVRGPRQIGKTTAQNQLLADLLRRGTPASHIMRVQFDEVRALRRLHEPITQIVTWFELHVLGATLNRAAERGQPTFLFFDEVQNIDAWAPQLKLLVDGSTTQVIVTGSSALRIEQGRDSLAGRISTIEAGVLSLTEIAAIRAIPLGEPFLADNGLEPLAQEGFWRDLAAHGRHRSAPRDAAFDVFCERGAYPLAHSHGDVPWSAVAEQLNENVIRRVIQHDLRVGERGRRRDAALLGELFRLACRFAGQAPAPKTFLDEVKRVLDADVGAARVRHYLRFLADTLLIRLIGPLEIRLKKRAANSKICLADHGLRRSWLQETVPLAPGPTPPPQHLATLAGYLAESILGATLATVRGLELATLPSRRGAAEIDFVLTLGTQHVPIEVKYQRRPDPRRDTAALRAYLADPLNRAPFGIVVTQSETEADFGPHVVALPLASLMLLR